MKATTNLKYFIFIIHIILIIKSEDTRQCKTVNSQWKDGDTHYTSLPYNKAIYVFALCKAGYTISGPNIIRCVDGWWESPLPRCKRVSSDMCDDPLSGIEKLVKNCDTPALTVGTRCTFRCQKSYRLIGSTERVCMSNLRWSGVKPRCVFSKANPSSVFASAPYNNESEGSLGNVTNHDGGRSCLVNNGGCGQQLCGFSKGYIECLCRNGYARLQNGSCMDIDECKGRRHYCNQTCINTQGSYACGCYRGYELKNKYHCDANLVSTNDSSPFNRVPEKKPGILSNRRVNPCGINNGGCGNQICDSSNGVKECLCKKGYRRSEDGTCRDIDECKEMLHYCNQTCINSQGSYKCGCHQGYELKNKYHCIDIDECKFKARNKCNQKCVNTLGSYTCSCEPGYILKNSHECEGCRLNSYKSETDNVCVECPPYSATSSKAKQSLADCHCLPGFNGNISLGIPCNDINECFINKFGCSHACINTPGSAHCSCPLGFQLLANNKTCVDIDECETKNGGCDMKCHNSVGSFSCSCGSGFSLAKDNYSCTDDDECTENNGDCSDICENFLGGYYCSCPTGYRLDVKGKTCKANSCPSVGAPHYSSLQCTTLDKRKVVQAPNENSLHHLSEYPVHTMCRVKCAKGYSVNATYETVECMEDGSWNATVPRCHAAHCSPLTIPVNGDVFPAVCKRDFIPVRQQCYFTCNPGYELVGKKQMLKCKNNLSWTSDSPICTPVFTAPSITCPDDLTVDLELDESTANLSIPRPITNMEITEIYPDWVQMEEYIIFPSGKTEVLFRVTNADSNETTQCVMTVNVIDKQPPVFVTCPESFNVSRVGSQSTAVTWDEPIAEDNVGIESIIKNLAPNSSLTAGIHYVEYTAKDAAGNAALCAFQITVLRNYCEDLADPEYGKLNCFEWLRGKLCRAACDAGYERDPNEPKYFACGESGQWTPTDIISPCHLECANGTSWSPLSESCEEE